MVTEVKQKKITSKMFLWQRHVHALCQFNMLLIDALFSLITQRLFLSGTLALIDHFNVVSVCMYVCVCLGVRANLFQSSALCWLLMFFFRFFFVCVFFRFFLVVQLMRMCFRLP